MSTLGFGVGLCHKKAGGGAPASLGALQIDGFDVLIDTFQINFA